MIQPVAPAGGGSPNMTINADLVPADAEPVIVLSDVMSGAVRSTPGAEEVRSAEPIESGTLRSAMGAIRIPAEPAPILQVLTLLVVDTELPGDVTYAFTMVCTWAEGDGLARETMHRIQNSFALVGAAEESVACGR